MQNVCRDAAHRKLPVNVVMMITLAKIIVGVRLFDQTTGPLYYFPLMKDVCGCYQKARIFTGLNC